MSATARPRGVGSIASWLLGVSVRRYRELEDGEAYPSYGEWSRIVDVFERWWNPPEVSF